MASTLGVLAFLLGVGCGDDSSDPTDAGPIDADPQDAGPPDAGSPPPQTCAEVEATLADGAEALVSTDGDLTLSGAYTVTGRVTFDAGETVTIEPGTVFLMEPDSLIIFGWRLDPATVMAMGTEEAPILFCGTDPTVGSWRGLSLEGGTTSDSELRHVRIEHAGAADAPALDTASAVLLDHVTISGAASTGLRMLDADPASGDLRVEGAALAVQLRDGRSIDAFPPGEYTGNARDLAEIEEEYGGDVTFADRGIPYLQLAERITLDEESTVTFEAGVEYRFSQDSFMIVGWRLSTASIFVEGTAEAPVVFTSHRDGDGAAPGDWRGINLEGGTTTDSSFRHAVFRFGGIAPQDGDGDCTTSTSGGQLCANLHVAHDGNITIEDTAFESSAGYGVYFGPNQSGLAVNGMTDLLGAIVGSGNTFMDNAAGDAFIGVGP